MATSTAELEAVIEGLLVLLEEAADCVPPNNEEFIRRAKGLVGMKETKNVVLTVEGPVSTSLSFEEFRQALKAGDLIVSYRLQGGKESGSISVDRVMAVDKP